MKNITLLFIFIISVTSCFAVSSGSTTAITVMDVKQRGDNITILLANESGIYERSTLSHINHHEFKKMELYITETQATEFLNKKTKLTFRKVGEVKDPSATILLNIANNKIGLMSWNYKCSIFDGECKEVLVDKSKSEIAHDAYASHEAFINLSGIKYEFEMNFSGNPFFKLSPVENDVDPILKEYRLVNGEHLTLTILNSSEK